MTKDSQGPVTDIKSIAVIGAGPSGAGALKAFLAEKKFEKLVAYERRSDFGGLWNYTSKAGDDIPVPSESVNVDSKPYFDKTTNKYVWTSPVYDYLETNVPKDIMTYARNSFSKDEPIFPFRDVVLDYMKDYAAGLEPYVRFNTTVIDVSLLNGTKWQVTSRIISKETNGGKDSSSEPGFEDKFEIFDAVVIAVGNYDVPYIPSKPGIEEWVKRYPKSITHVKSYRNPQQYKPEDGRILIVGNSASASDLAYQITKESDIKIYKSKRSENLMPAPSNGKIIDVPDISSFDAEKKAVIFKDGLVLENVGNVIFATGYLKCFNFLNDKSFSAKPILTDGHKVHGNYQHVILYNYPNLAVVGVPRFVLPTRTSEAQGCWLAKIWSGRINLPSVEEMRSWEQSRVEERGNGKSFHDLNFPEDVNYCNFLNNQVLESIQGLHESEAGLLPHIWSKEETAVRGFIKHLKEGFVKYREATGKGAKNYLELIESGIIEDYMLNDKQLENLGFKFYE